MKYKLFRTESFNEELNEIVYYIANAAKDSKVALNYLEKIEKAVLVLESFPESGSIPQLSTISKQGYRYIVCENHLIFYKFNADKKEVILYRIIDHRRNYNKLI